MISGREIARQVAAGTIVIQDFDPANLNPNSYNLRLGPKLLVYEKNMPLHRWHERRHAFHQVQRRREFLDRDPEPRELPPYVEPLDMAAREPTVELAIPEDGFNLWPGVLYLGHTLEYTETRGYAPKIDGRSSVGRLGKTIHVTAGFGDDGFCGDWTLEVTVVTPLTVYPGVPVCQIAFSTLEGERTPYAGQYQGQRGPKASGLWRAVSKLLGRAG